MIVNAQEFLSRSLIMDSWVVRMEDPSITKKLVMDVAAEVVVEEGREFSYKADKEVMTVISYSCGFVVGKILEYRYVSGFPWSDIALITGYSRRHLSRLHRIGLEQVQDYLDRNKDREAAG